MDYSSSDVARYYHDTRWQYYGLWSKQDSLALHYGYWDEGVASHSQALLRLNELLADKAGIDAADNLLDAGCGWGGSSIWLASQRGARCHGISLERDQIDVARKMAAKKRVAANTAFSQQNFTATAFADASFDVVWAVESVCHIHDKRDFTREAYRLLKPGGRLILSDFFRTHREQSPADEAHLRSWFEKWVVPDLDTLEEFRQAVGASGFSGIEITDATGNIRPSAERLYRTGRWTAPLARLFHWLGIHNDMQDANWRSSLSQYTTLRDDLWRYGIVSARKPYSVAS